MAYLILLILSLTGIAVYDGRRERRSGMILYIILGISAAVVAGLRYRLGVDTVHDECLIRQYEISPEDMTSMIWSRFSAVYMGLYWLTRQFTTEMWPIQMVYSLWISFSVFTFGYLYRREMGGRLFLYATLYLLLMYLPMNFETYRQGAAIGFFLFAWYNLQHGRHWQYIVLCVCAAICHRFAIITLAFAVCDTRWFARVVSNRMTVSVLIVVSLIGGFALEYVMCMLNGALPARVGNMSQIGGYLVQMSELTWRRVIGVIFVTILYPVVAMRLLRRVNTAVMLAVFIVVMSIGSKTMLRIYDFLSLICILEVVKCVSVRQDIMSWPMWTLCFVVLGVVALCKYAISYEWVDCKRHYAYEIYVPYVSVLDKERNIVREMECESRFGWDTPEAVIELSDNVRAGGTLTAEEERWIERMSTRHHVEGEADCRDMEEYVIKVRENYGR